MPTGSRPKSRSIRYVIEKGLEQQVVLYWYQSHGRVIANEYRSKIFMVYDAARLNRSDAALVRVTSAKLGSESTFQDADARAVEFVKSTFPESREVSAVVNHFSDDLLLDFP